MKSSQLVAIIKRLEAMQEVPADGEPQTRRFEKMGLKKALSRLMPRHKHMN